jgi:hypothetical protein
MDKKRKNKISDFPTCVKPGVGSGSKIGIGRVRVCIKTRVGDPAFQLNPDPVPDLGF